MTTPRLSRHFTLDEFTRSQTATRKGIDNVPGKKAVANLYLLCANVMEPVRELLGHPIHITSGYRGLLLNAHIGGASGSQHTKGQAADFVCPGYGSPQEVAEAISRSGIQFDQLIYEGSWVHISYKENPRRKVLTAIFHDGRVEYRPGIV